MTRSFRGISITDPEFRQRLDDMSEWIEAVKNLTVAEPLALIRKMPGVGIEIGIDDTGGGADQATSVRMVVKEEFNDYLRCRTVFESEEGQHEEGEADILVAKPWKLRHEADQYPGVTGITTSGPSQVAAANGEDETWVVHWPYTVGDHITASQPRGGTGVWVDDQQLVWLDDNRDGRVWRLVEDDD